MNNMIFPLITEFDQKLPFYLTGVGCFHNQEHITRPHGFTQFQWIQCYKGKGELLVDGNEYIVNENQGIFLYPNVPHEYYALTDTWEVDWITFSGFQIDYFISMTANIKKSGVFYISRPEIILSNIRKAFVTEQSEKPMKSLECSSILYEILMDLLKYTSPEGSNSLQSRYIKLEPLLNYIDENYNKPLPLDFLAEIAGITPQHLCIVFKKATGTRISEYINFLRIKKSKELISQNKHIQIKEIAILSGFYDVSYFCSVFKRIEKLSPGEFKKLHGF